MQLFTTWEEWLDAGSIPLSLAAPLITCGPCFNDCELTRAGMCAVQMRGLSVLEKWQNLKECGLCQGIEYARSVARLNKLLDTASLAGGGKTTLTKIVEWGQSKKGVTLPQGLLDILQKDSSPTSPITPPVQELKPRPDEISVKNIQSAYFLEKHELQLVAKNITMRDWFSEVFDGKKTDHGQLLQVLDNLSNYHDFILFNKWEVVWQIYQVTGKHMLIQEVEGLSQALVNDIIELKRQEQRRQQLNTSLTDTPQDDTPLRPATTTAAGPEPKQPVNAIPPALEANNQRGGTKKTYNLRGEISARKAAELLGVTERTIRNWEAGKNTPKGYPNRTDEIAFDMFINQYKQTQRLKNMARAINRATPGGDMDNYPDEDY